MNKPEQPDDLLSAGEAAEYLAKRWGRQEYKTTAFKQLRHRWGLEPALKTENATLWRRRDLENIPEPSRNRPRPSRKKKEATETEKNVDNSEYRVLSLA